MQELPYYSPIFILSYFAQIIPGIISALLIVAVFWPCSILMLYYSKCVDGISEWDI